MLSVLKRKIHNQVEKFKSRFKEVGQECIEQHPEVQKKPPSKRKSLLIGFLTALSIIIGRDIKIFSHKIRVVKSRELPLLIYIKPSKIKKHSKDFAVQAWLKLELVSLLFFIC